MTTCKISLSPVSEQQNPIFEPADIKCGSLIEVKIMEKETSNGRTAVAGLIELPNGDRVMFKTTALIMDGINGAMRAGCLMWGDLDNYQNNPQS